MTIFSHSSLLSMSQLMTAGPFELPPRRGARDFFLCKRRLVLGDVLAIFAACALDTTVRLDTAVTPTGTAKAMLIDIAVAAKVENNLLFIVLLL